jgi:hypothetical protein
MKPEDVTFIKNRKVDDHLMDKDGFAYKWIKSVPLKVKSYWNDMF